MLKRERACLASDRDNTPALPQAGIQCLPGVRQGKITD